MLVGRREILALGAGAACAAVVPSAFAQTATTGGLSQAFDIIHGFRRELNTVLRTGGVDASRRLNALLAEAATVVPAGGGWSIHHGGNMVVAIRPVFTNASTRTTSMAARRLTNGQQLLSLITSPSATESDGIGLSNQLLAPDANVRLMERIGESRWSLGIAMGAEVTTGHVSVGLLLPRGTWAIRRY